MSLYNNILESIGNTPLVRLEKLEIKEKLNNQIYGKLESFNPGNNVKVRPAYQMIKSLRDACVLKEDSIIVEATSGNTGIGLAMVGAFFDYKVIIIMPDKVSKERIDVIRHYGAEIILTPKEEGMKGAQVKACQIAEDSRVIIPSQFDNEENPRSHYLTTAVEIENDLHQVDYIFIGVGTGGTITGVGRYFKEKHPKTKIIAVEPEESKVLQGFEAHPHKIAGISPGFIPANYDKTVVDHIESIGQDASWARTQSFVQLEAISIGISSGAVIQAAINYLKRNNIQNKQVVCILPDSGEKYFSTGVFDKK